MKTTTATSGAPVKLQNDGYSLTWKFSIQTRACARRFARVCAAAILSEPQRNAAALAPHGLLAARLICLDGVRPDVLPLLENTGTVPYRCGDQVAVEWTEGPASRVERRFIHPLTLAVWPAALRMPASDGARHTTAQDESSGDFTNTAQSPLSKAAMDGPKPVLLRHLPVGDLQEGLRQWLVSTGIYTDTCHALEQLAWDQIAWWSETLPGPLFAHCTGGLVLSAVDRSTWGRLHSGQALVEFDPNIERDSSGQPFVALAPATSALSVDEQPLDLNVTEDLLEQLDSTGSSGFNASELKAAQGVLKLNHPSNIDGLTKRQWLADLQRLPLGSARISHVTVVLVGWICHMCEVGTISTSNPAVSTIRSYVSSVLIPLGMALEDEENQPEDWSAKDLLRHYKSIYANKSPGSRPAALAALQSFQDYLFQAFDTEQLFERIAGTERLPDEGTGEDSTDDRKSDKSEADTSPGIYVSKVIANVVWSHEVDWCIQACNTAPDPRMGGIARVMLVIARESPVRYQDLSRLKMKSIAFLHDARGPYCRIEVIREASAGRLKTEQSQRHLIVRCKESIKIICAWFERRREETPNSGAYVFGEINADGKKYRPSGVQGFLGKLLKRATGCKRIRFYDLRHSVISKRVGETLMSSAWVDANLLEIIASEAGHASPSTTLHSYSHLYEQPLRLNIDVALERGFSATYADMACVLGRLLPRNRALNANSLVQMVKRRRTELNPFWFSLLRTAAETIPVESVSEPFQWDEPQPIVAKVSARETVPIHLLADAIDRWANHTTSHSVAVVTGIPIEQITELFERLTTWLFFLYQRQFPRRAFRVKLRPTLKELMTSMNISTSKTTHTIWSPLERHLQSQSNITDLRSVIEYWESAAPGTHLRLDKQTTPRSLIGLLKDAGMNRGHLRVVIQEKNDRQLPAGATKSDRVPDQESLQGVTEWFEQEFGAAPLVEVKAWRADRPMAYMKINPHEHAPATGAPEDQTAALRGWMLAIKARLILEEIGEASNG